MTEIDLYARGWDDCLKHVLHLLQNKDEIDQVRLLVQKELVDGYAGTPRIKTSSGYRSLR